MPLLHFLCFARERERENGESARGSAFVESVPYTGREERIGDGCAKPSMRKLFLFLFLFFFLSFFLSLFFSSGPNGTVRARI